LGGFCIKESPLTPLFQEGNLKLVYQKMVVYNNAAMNNLFEGVKTIAIIGLSDKPERHSHRVAKYLQSKGFRIVPVNPALTEVLGEKAYPNLLAIPNTIHVDIVDIFRRPEEVMPHMQEVLRRKIKTVWLQEGVSSPEVEQFAKEKGLTLVANFCIMDGHKQITKT
jgi:predicted CoA-binding protein